MGNTLGHRPERLQPVQPATADDEEVAISGGGHERRHRLVGQVFVTTIDDLRDEAFVDALAAVRHDRPELGGVAIGEIPRRRRFRRAVGADGDPAWKVRASVAVEPTTMPRVRPMPCEPTAISVARPRSASRISSCQELPRTTFAIDEEWPWICSRTLRSASSAPLRCTSSSK